MPELPEVETMVAGLRGTVLGQRVDKVRLFCDRLESQTSNEELRQVRGGQVIGLSRRGKFLLFHLSNGSLMVFHLRMTGKLLLVPSTLPLSGRDRMRLDFEESDWAISFEDQRRFGSLAVLGLGHDAPAGLLDELGPDALTVGLAEFREILAESRRPVKALLLDQRLIAGLGNIYVDESLHRAGIHPRTPAAAVPPDQVRRLHGALRRILRRAIDCRGSSVRNFRDSNDAPGSFQKHHRVYRRDGKPCRACTTPIAYIRVASRGTRFCPTCQPEPAVKRTRRRA